MTCIYYKLKWRKFGREKKKNTDLSQNKKEKETNRNAFPKTHLVFQKNFVACWHLHSDLFFETRKYLWRKSRSNKTDHFKGWNISKRILWINQYRWIWTFWGKNVVEHNELFKKKIRRKLSFVPNGYFVCLTFQCKTSEITSRRKFPLSVSCKNLIDHSPFGTNKLERTKLSLWCRRRKTKNDKKI